MAHYDTTGQFNCNFTGLGGKACYIGCYNSMWGGPESATWWPYTEDGSCTNTAAHCTQSFEWFQDFCDTVGTHDCCGVPDGDGTSCPDCLGVHCGSAEFDECGVCDGPGVGGCNNDCNWDTLDDCGVCDGDGSSCFCDQVPIPYGCDGYVAPGIDLDFSDSFGSSGFFCIPIGGCNLFPPGSSNPRAYGTALIDDPCTCNGCPTGYECCYGNIVPGAIPQGDPPWTVNENGYCTPGSQSQQNNGILVRGSRKRKGSLGNKKPVNKR